MMDEFESQRRARVDAYVVELSVKMRHVNNDWERRLKRHPKVGPRSRLDCWQTWKSLRRHSVVWRTGSRTLKALYVTGDTTTKLNGGQKNRPLTGPRRRADRVLVTQCVIRPRRELHIMVLIAMTAYLLWEQMLLGI